MTAVPTGAPVGSAALGDSVVVRAGSVEALSDAAALVVFATGVPAVVVHPAATAATDTTLMVTAARPLSGRIPEITTPGWARIAYRDK
ncbi:hypothetical protein H7J71_20885 [Mycolicibacterium peregrinum]|nr:hypothetical protein [Mycolicibacterium peregrinum]